MTTMMSCEQARELLLSGPSAGAVEPDASLLEALFGHLDACAGCARLESRELSPALGRDKATVFQGASALALPALLRGTDFASSVLRASELCRLSSEVFHRSSEPSESSLRAALDHLDSCGSCQLDLNGAAGRLEDSAPAPIAKLLESEGVGDWSSFQLELFGQIKAGSESLALLRGGAREISAERAQALWTELESSPSLASLEETEAPAPVRAMCHAHAPGFVGAIWRPEPLEASRPSQDSGRLSRLGAVVAGPVFADAWEDPSWSEGETTSSTRETAGERSWLSYAAAMMAMAAALLLLFTIEGRGPLGSDEGARGLAGRKDSHERRGRSTPVRVFEAGFELGKIEWLELGSDAPKGAGVNEATLPSREGVEYSLPRSQVPESRPLPKEPEKRESAAPEGKRRAWISTNSGDPALSF